MPKFKKDTSVDVDVTIDISVDDFHSEMTDSDNKEMLELLYQDGNFDIENMVDSMSDKDKFYKDFAYYVGVQDASNLETFITELQYWSKK